MILDGIHEHDGGSTGVPAIDAADCPSHREAVALNDPHAANTLAMWRKVEGNRAYLAAMRAMGVRPVVEMPLHPMAERKAGRLGLWQWTAAVFAFGVVFGAAVHQPIIDFVRWIAGVAL